VVCGKPLGLDLAVHKEVYVVSEFVVFAYCPHKYLGAAVVVVVVVVGAGVVVVVVVVGAAVVDAQAALHADKELYGPI
jgi:hypothetical protein